MATSPHTDLGNDPLLRLWRRGSVAIGTLALAAIVVGVGIEAEPLRRLPFDALWRGPLWEPSEGRYNLAPMVATTAVIAVVTATLATAWGAGLALWLHRLAPRKWVRTARSLLAMAAAVPSVLIGLWGLLVVVPILRRWAPPGLDLAAAVLVVGTLLLPQTTLLLLIALAGTPRGEALQAEALGLSRWARIRLSDLPRLRRALPEAFVLAWGRGAGETIAVLMVAGNVVAWPTAPTRAVRTLTANIALELGYAEGVHRAALFAGGAITLIVALGTTLLVQRRRRRHAA